MPPSAKAPFLRYSSTVIRIPITNRGIPMKLYREKQQIPRQAMEDARQRPKVNFQSSAFLQKM